MSELKAVAIIKEARKAKGLTQEEVAAQLQEKLGRYSLRQYQKLEAGEFPIYKEKVVTELEEILGIEISDLIYGNKAHESDPSELYSKGPQNSLLYRPGEFPYISIAAQANYVIHFESPTFINNLQRVRLPLITYQGEKFRAFEVNQEAMDRHNIGDFVICNKVELHPSIQIIDDVLYTVVRQTDIVMGWLMTKDNEQLILQSQNADFNRQTLLPIKDIKELWSVILTTHIAKPPVIRRFNIEI